MNNKILYYYLRKDLSSPYYVGVGNPKRIHCHHPRKNGSNVLPKERWRRVIIKEGLSKEESFELEKLHIKLWGREIDGGVLLNENLGGTGKLGGQKTSGFSGRKHSPESKLKTSLSLRGEKNPNYGNRFSKEERKKFNHKQNYGGENNPNSKSFMFFSKDEEIIVSGGFKRFCEEKEISFHTMRMRLTMKRTGLGRNGWGVIPI